MTTPTQVIIGQVEIDSQDAKFKASESVGLNDYKAISRYESDRHTYMMGITSPNGFQGNNVAFVRLAAPTLLWIIDWTASWFGKTPPIPDPEKVDGGWVLLDDHYETFIIGIAPNGESPLYRMNGTYVYGHKTPNSKPVLNVSYPKPPHFQDAFLRTISLASLEGGISSPGSTGSVPASSNTPTLNLNIKKILG